MEKDPRSAIATTGAPADYTRGLALLEDSPVHRQILRERLEAEGYNVLTPESREDCLYLLEFGCRTFLLDINMGAKRKIEGLEALEDIKRICPDAFCALVTGDNRYNDRANSFKADRICGKEEKDIDSLIDSLNELYFRRRFGMKDEPTLRSVGVRLRQETMPSEPGNSAVLSAGLAGAAAKSLFEFIDAHLREGDPDAAAKELVLLEPPLRDLIALSGTYGEGYGIASRALRNAILQHSASPLTENQWAVWRGVFESLLAEPGLSTREGCRLAGQLDRAGFNTEPPYWPTIAELLNADDASVS
jgi:CheY-like chemotaxis protein